MAVTPGPNHDTYLDQPDALDADMTPREVAEVLAGLRFNRHSGECIISIDKGARDYILAAVTARCGKA
jgi:hypothetical protein